ncbi:toxin-antitoxin system HicB family antitoxin [Streptomyces adonidis]|uniref:toxin-antitoxin system HicB family antitoxin n=1 Tax=Streptomyces adonidis TaxID=3231367 RepID=UPI0034DB522D
MSVFTVRIPDDLDAEVRKAAADAGLSLNAYMVRTLREQTLREALAAVDSEGVLLVDTGDDDPAEDIR